MKLNRDKRIELFQKLMNATEKMIFIQDPIAYSSTDYYIRTCIYYKYTLALCNQFIDGFNLNNLNDIKFPSISKDDTYDSDCELDSDPFETFLSEYSLEIDQYINTLSNWRHLKCSCDEDISYFHKQLSEYMNDKDIPNIIDVVSSYTCCGCFLDVLINFRLPDVLGNCCKELVDELNMYLDSPLLSPLYSNERFTNNFARTKKGYYLFNILGGWEIYFDNYVYRPSLLLMMYLIDLTIIEYDNNLWRK